MDPLTMMSLILSGGGALAGILGSPEQTIGSPSDVTNLNQAQTDQMLHQLTQLLGQAQGQTDQFTGQAAGQYGQLSAAGQQGLTTSNQLLGQGIGQANQAYNTLTSLQGQLANQPGFNPQGSTDIFQQNVPIFQDLANQARTEALSQFETPAATQAAFQADQNVQGAANQFAGLGAGTSGAAAAAAAQGAQAPLAQLAVDRANLANQAYAGTLNPLLQQGQQLASAENQFGYNAGINQLMQLIGAAQGQGQLGLGQAGAANQAQANAGQLAQAGASGLAGLSSLYAGLQGGALSGLTALSQPEYFAPTYQAGTGLLGLFG